MRTTTRTWRICPARGCGRPIRPDAPRGTRCNNCRLAAAAEAFDEEHDPPIESSRFAD